jgi:hypothetical protein
MPIGILALGAVPMGVIGLGGCSIALFSMGGLALGWLASGGVAIAWRAALGGVAVAHDYARGGVAIAAHANDAEAAAFFSSSGFFEFAQDQAKQMADQQRSLWFQGLIVVGVITAIVVGQLVRRARCKR